MNNKDKELNNEQNFERQYDALERVLAARPMVRAPRNTASRVMASIATLPQQAPVATFAPPAISQVKYAPPAALPLPEAEEEVGKVNRRVTGLAFTTTWISLCAFVIYLLVWPAISNLFLGGQNDMNVLTRTVQLWTGLVNTLGSFFTMVAPILPSLLSALIGLGIMLLIFTMQRRRLGVE